MPFGKVIGKNVKKAIEGGGQSLIRYVPKEDGITVRFLDDPEKWVRYSDHWDEGLNKSYPCSNEDTCPGCIAGDRKTKCYLANAVDCSDDRVIAFQVKQSVMNQLVLKMDRWGTLTGRDILISRYGSGKQTTYDIEPEAPRKRNLAKYQRLDLEDILEKVFQSVFGEDEDEDEDDEPRRTPRAKGRPVARRRGSWDEDEDEDEEPFAPRPRPKARPKGKVGPKKIH